MKLNRVYRTPLSTLGTGEKFFWSDHIPMQEVIKPVKCGSMVRNLETGVEQFLSDCVLVQVEKVE